MFMQIVQEQHDPDYDYELEEQDDEQSSCRFTYGDYLDYLYELHKEFNT